MTGLQDFISDLSLPEIWNFHADVEAALRMYFSSNSPGSEERYIGESIASIKGKRLQEADHRSSLIVLSSLEAAFRLDYQNRVLRKLRDPLSRSFRELHKVSGKSVRLDEDLFERWKIIYPLHKKIISDLRSAFKFRNWMAHGRYWKPNPGRYEFAYLYDLALLVSVTMDFQDLLGSKQNKISFE